MAQYFVTGALPPLILGHKPEMSYPEVRELLRLNLDPSEWDQVVAFQRLTDIRNLRALWMGQPLDMRGNFGEKELEEAVLVRDFLPPFVSDFLDRYDSKEARLRYFSALFSSQYTDASLRLTGFLLDYYRFEREVRLCLTALRAKETERDLIRELQFEDPSDPLVAELFAQKDSQDAVLPQEYEDLKTVFLENRSEPRKQYLAVLQFRFNRIEEMTMGKPFAIDQILSYLARLTIVEDWSMLDDEKGREALEQVCR